MMTKSEPEKWQDEIKKWQSEQDNTNFKNYVLKQKLKQVRKCNKDLVVGIIILIAILIVSAGIYLYTFNECRDMGFSLLYCLMR